MPPGRRPGVSSIRENVRRKEEMARRGAIISAETANQMKLQLQSFKGRLEQFAVLHKHEIQKDPAFRAKFHSMCASIGVDPLTSRKGIWSELLGVGDYYYELAVRIIEICVATRPTNGGIISLTELVSALRNRRTTFTEKVSRYVNSTCFSMTMTLSFFSRSSRIVLCSYKLKFSLFFFFFYVFVLSY